MLTGFDEYCATVTAPTPVALTEVLSLVALAVPVELVDDPLAWLLDPAGGVGVTGVGVTGVGASGVTEFEAVDAELVPPPLVAVEVKV